MRLGEWIDTAIHHSPTHSTYPDEKTGRHADRLLMTTSEAVEEKTRNGI
jgi:hypothetical protein